MIEKTLDFEVKFSTEYLFLPRTLDHIQLVSSYQTLL